MNLDIYDGVKLIEKAYEKEFESALYKRWLVDYSHMDEKTFIPFEDYKNKFVVRQVDNRTMDEVLKEAEEIALKVSQKRGE